MLATLALLLATPALPLQEPEQTEAATKKEKPTPEEAAASIEAAFDGDDAAALIDALHELGLIEGKEVVKAVLPGLRHKDPEVRAEALRALRFNEDPSALDNLLKLSRDKKLLEDDKFAAEYYLALGQKADPKALKVLADDLVIESERSQSTRARVVAMGRIRDKRSVEELMGFFVKGRGNREHPYAREISLALTILTGEQHRNKDAWQRWWNNNKNTFEISEEPWELPQRFQRQWDRVWATPEQIAAAKAKRQRGETEEEEEPDIP